MGKTSRKKYTPEFKAQVAIVLIPDDTRSLFVRKTEIGYEVNTTGKFEMI